jgi:hypothetical protein
MPRWSAVEEAQTEGSQTSEAFARLGTRLGIATPVDSQGRELDLRVASHSREATVRRARFVVGAAWGLLAITISVGCASHNAAASRAALAAPGSTSAARLEGVWEGEVWETPSYCNQGVRRIAVKVSSDGSWTASSSGAVCATGTAVARDSLFILDRNPVGPDLCMPRSLKIGDGYMWAAFETSFRGRTVAAEAAGER